MTQLDIDAVRATFAGRRVLVTGHTGFKGAWLSAWLKRWGAKVSGLALEPDRGQRELFGLVSATVDFESSTYGDIVDSSVVDRVFEESDPEIVLHLAAQPLVRLSYDDPVGTYATNVMGTAHVLEAARRHETPTVVCVTTDKCYENVEQIWPYRETDSMGGWDPYSSSKGAAELLITSYRRSFFDPQGHVACASARAGNVVGGGDLGRDRLVPDIYRAMEARTSLVLRRPRAVRPWQHVLESLSGYLTLAAALEHGRSAYSGGWNFGPNSDERFTVESFVDEVSKALGGAAPDVVIEEDGPHEAAMLSLDITKARLELGWSPVLSLRERAELTAEWFERSLGRRLEAQLLDDHLVCFEDLWRRRS